MKILGFSLLAIILILVGSTLYSRAVMNPRVIRELYEDPDGERARKVMLLTLPSGKQIPINYLKEGQTAYAAADFPWWRELGDSGVPVQVLIRGVESQGIARAVLEDPVLRTSVFNQLRPSAPSWTGTLVQVDLEPDV